MRELLDEMLIARRVRELAAGIEADYAGSRDLVFVAILRGSVCFAADLLRATSRPVRIDFVGVRSYQGTSAGKLELTMPLSDPIAGADVVIVEDIVERGTTLGYVVDELQRLVPRSLEICTLLRKPDAAGPGTPKPKYVGFDIGPEFVVGYGLDYDQHYRNLRSICVLEPGDLTPEAPQLTTPELP